ncbi:MAG: hypothetical protein R3A52_15780 [Polyangiales bacterium]
MRLAAALPLPLALSLTPFGCHRRPSPRPRAADASAPTPSAWRWRASPALAPSQTVDTTRALHGALRVEGERRAVGPWPAAPLVAAARVADGWRFVDVTGAVYASTDFTGPLRVVGALPRRATPPRLDHAALSTGGLFVIDDRRDAWTLSPDGAPRKLPLARVLDGVFTAPEVAIAVVEPGVLLRSRDGGRSFHPVSLPAGAATGVTPTRVLSTEGALRFEGDALVRATDEDVATPEAPTPDAALPSRADEAVSTSDGAVARVRGDEVLRVDARDGAVRDRWPAPGRDCASRARATGCAPCVTTTGGPPPCTPSTTARARGGRCATRRARSPWAR